MIENRDNSNIMPMVKVKDDVPNISLMNGSNVIILVDTAKK